MRIKIFYPSGNILHLSGEWKGPGNVDGTCIILILIEKDCKVPGGSVITKGSAFVGDPRGIYQNEDTGEILYNPRDAMIGMDNWAVNWLNEHPEWPQLLEMKGLENDL